MIKFTINGKVLNREYLSIGEYLLLLLGFYNIDYNKSFAKLVNKGLIKPDLFNQSSFVLSDNTRDLVAKIMLESDDKAIKSDINFEELAKKLQDIYPEGKKPGTTYNWRSETNVIAQKLRTLVVKYDFSFTEEEAVNATKEYVSSFKNLKYMQLLRYFLLKTKNDGHGQIEMESPFMTIIENNR